MQMDIQLLLQNAYERRASDVHISVGMPPVFRVNGRLEQQGYKPLTGEDTEAIARTVVSETKWNQFLKAGELDFAYRLKDVSRYRVNMFRQRDEISIVFRIIPTEIPTLDNLHMPPILKEIALKPQGLFLVTGPTGSGKSTTLAAMINHINRKEKKHIITLEDPIEFEHEHQLSIVNQREIGTDTSGFATGLRAALRQDPDVILVGEMRDYATISTALTAAETGHLVLATLHTSSAVQTINRIIDVFPPHQQGQIRSQLSMVLVAVLSQRLIPLFDGSGRVAATEVLVNVPSVANLIRNEKIEQIPNVMQTSRSLGMHTLGSSLQGLISSGKIDPGYLEAYSMSKGDD